MLPVIFSSGGVQGARDDDPRASPHLNAWYDAYRDDGLTMIAVHSPEYAFEKVPGNAVAGAARLGMTYPIALDNDFATWTANNNYPWPAEYLRTHRARSGTSAMAGAATRTQSRSSGNC